MTSVLSFSFIHSTKTYWVPVVFQAVLDSEERGKEDTFPNLLLLTEIREKIKNIEVPNVWPQNYGIYSSERSLRESVISVRSSGTRRILIHMKNREIITVQENDRSRR